MLAAAVSSVPEGWRKASYSSGQNGCVEVGESTGQIHIRDTKDRDGPVLSVSAEAWRAFSDRVRNA